MSSILKKKAKKKKKKKQDNSNEIVPQRHEREGNLNYYSEEIAKIMFEKILSLALTRTITQNVEKKFDTFCIDLTTKTLNNLVQMTYINRDKDDFDVDNIDIKTYIRYNKTDMNTKRYRNKRHTEAWETRNDNAETDLMEMANIPTDMKTYMNVNKKKIEDFLNNSTTITNNKSLKNKKIYQYNINIEKNNFWGDIPQPKSIKIDRTTSNFNGYIPRKGDKNKLLHSPKKNANKSQDDKPPQKKGNFYYKYFRKLSKGMESNRDNKNKKNNYEDENTSRKKRITMVNLPSYPLDNLEIRKESEEILNLRKEKLDLINLKEKELQEIRKIKIKIKNDLEKEKDKKKKKGKFTFDNEGKILLVNEIKPDNFLKEFWPVMSKQKEVRSGKSLEYIKKEKLRMENNAKKNIEYNEEDRPYKVFLLKTRMNDFSFSDTNKENNEKEKENKTDTVSGPGPGAGNKNNVKDIKKKNINSINDYNSYLIEPSGSNFQLMNPSVGVKIQEKLKVKHGGNNFYEQFHKYSINEFNKTLQDTIEWTKYRLKEQQNDGFMTTNQLNRLKNIKSIKEEKEIKGLNTSETNNMKKNNKLNYFQKTFTNGFNKKHKLIQSKSEIISSLEKFPKLKQILFHEEQNEKMLMMKYNKLKNKTALENIIGSAKQNNVSRNNSMIEVYKKKKYLDVDNFNKKIIMGVAVPERVNMRKMVLPKISWRTNNNDNNFNNTTTTFYRTRIKKGSMEDISKKLKEKKRIKKKERINSVEVDE